MKATSTSPGKSGNSGDGNRKPLFWKVLLLALVVSLLPLTFAMYMALTTSTDVTERLLKQNLTQMAKQVAERTSYTVVSMDSDLDVMGDLPLSVRAYVAFSRAQRRELYSEADGVRRMEAVPKYREVAFYPVTGSPIVIVDDVPVQAPEMFVPGANRWCEQDDFIEAAQDGAGGPVVSGLVGCHFSISQYGPAEGRLGRQYDGGIRVSKALLDGAGNLKGVATLVLSQLHLVWALQSLKASGEEEGVWAMMVNREGWVLAHPEPQFTLGYDQAGRLVDGKDWEAGRAINLLRLPNPVGERFASLLDAAGRGTPSTAVIDEEKRGHWVAAAYPIEAEVGPYSPKNPAGTVVVLYPRDKAMAVTDLLKRNLAVLIGLTVLLVMLGSALLAGHISRPIRRLAIAAKKLAKGEVKPMRWKRRDEIGDLARAFDQMQTDLETSREALLKAERLAAIGRFVSGIVHEVKNNLAGLGNYMAVLERKVDPEVQRKVMGPMRRALEQMDGLVVRLRELALKPQFALTDLKQVLEHAVELVAAEATSKNIEMAVDMPDDLELPHADGSLLGQVFLNLLINALEASESGGKVHVSAARRDDQLLVAIRDSGPGLPHVSPDRLLEPFFTTKPGGTGLGLYISNSIVERHNGLFVLANHPDGGAQMEVWLPV